MKVKLLVKWIEFSVKNSMNNILLIFFYINVLRLVVCNVIFNL